MQATIAYLRKKIRSSLSDDARLSKRIDKVRVSYSILHQLKLRLKIHVRRLALEPRQACAISPMIAVTECQVTPLQRPVLFLRRMRLL